MREAISVSLPGQEAQSRAIPPNRPMTDLDEVRTHAKARKAAVLALIHPIEGESHIALIQRNKYPGVHSGQISFPGGKMEREDTSLLVTAQRETHEEVGIHSSQYETWGELTEVFIPPSQFLVQPYLALAKDELNFTPDPREVEQIVHAPLHQFLRPNAMVERQIQVGTYQVKVPVYDYNGHIIWGATAMMLSEIGELLKRATTR